jgi:hypothetical protein
MDTSVGEKDGMGKVLGAGELLNTGPAYMN